MYLTMGLLFVPKMIYVLRGLHKGEPADGIQGGPAGTYTSASRNAATNTEESSRTAGQARNVTNYTEFSESENSESDYEGGGITGGVGGMGESIVEGGTVRGEDFISENISRGSTMAGSGTMASAGSGTAPTSAGGSTTMDSPIPPTPPVIPPDPQPSATAP